jgi:hypothetical protein
MQKDSVTLAPEILAAKLLSRALHDVAGPTSGLTAALDLLGDAESGELHAQALALARDSLTQMAARIAFCRAAYGGGGLDTEAFETLLQIPFQGSRARLESSTIMPGAPPTLIQGALILLQLSVEALASGGSARLSLELQNGTWRALVEGEAARVRMAPETRSGLDGQALGAGLSGRWAPARYLRALADSAGGSLEISVDERGFRLGFACRDELAPSLRQASEV